MCYVLVLFYIHQEILDLPVQRGDVWGVFFAFHSMALDEGGEFDGEKFESLCDTYGINFGCVANYLRQNEPAYYNARFTTEELCYSRWLKKWCGCCPSRTVNLVNRIIEDFF